MRPVLLRLESGQFVDATAGAGAWFETPALGRGLAVGDLDGDGKLDLAAAALDRPAAILHNRAEAGADFALEIVNRQGAPAVGAVVRLTLGLRTTTYLVTSGGSYLAHSDPRILISLGGRTRIDELEVEWPFGGRRIWRLVDPPRGVWRIGPDASAALSPLGNSLAGDAIAQ